MLVQLDYRLQHITYLFLTVLVTRDITIELKESKKTIYINGWRSTVQYIFIKRVLKDTSSMYLSQYITGNEKLNRNKKLKISD